MPDAENGQHTNTPIKTPRKDRGWIRFISYVKREMHERRAKKQDESTVDRAARRTANATVWLAVFTVILAATSLGTVWILKNQLIEMHDGGIDTHALADATGKMKDSAEKSAQASRDFADTADDINGNINDAVKKLDAQAKAIENSRKSSDTASSKSLNASIESSRLDQRAWMGVSEVNFAEPSQEKGFPVAVLFVNSGKTPANNVQIAGGYHYSSSPVYGPSQAEIRNLGFHSVQAAAPQAKFNDVLGYLTANGDTSSASDLAGTVDIRAHFQSIMEGKLTLYYYGTMKYDDVFGNLRTTNFCVYLADAKLKIGAFCRDFNNLN